MKVAKIALIFTFVLFISTAAFSHAKAAESSTLHLVGRVPMNTTFDYSSMQFSANFEFYGKVEYTQLSKNIETSKDGHKIVSIIIN